jgi:hypothetical protein
MSLILSGTDGLSDVDGSASTPAIRGTDTNTGIFFPAADTIAFAEGGAEVARFDSSGNLGIGTSSPAQKVDVVGTQGRIRLDPTNNSGVCVINFTDVAASNFGVGTLASSELRMNTAGSERMRINSSGYLLVNCTATPSSSVGGILLANPYNFAPIFSTAPSTGVATAISFVNGNGTVGAINTSGSNTVFSTSSDYRLKDNIAPMTGALDKVSALKPCTYTWKIDGSSGEGFIAHELAEVAPQAVIGQKDDVDGEGNPKYQAIDTSFLVATLTAAIQELKAELDSVKAELATLKA